jgi:NADH dehydrogenase
MKVFLTGSSGFVGSHTLRRLLARGHSIHALVRNPGNTKTNTQNAACQYFTGNVVTGEGLDPAIHGCDAVIHLVGIIAEKGSNTFEAVHHLGTRNVVMAAQRSGIRRFVHLSALGVRADGVAAYQTTKWKGEDEVRRSGIPFCILRPSLIFGPGDGFVTQMIEIMRKAPVVRPVPGNGSPRFRPIFVDDVTFCLERALTLEGARNQTIELGGADELSLNEVLAEVARCTGARKPALHIPMPLMFVAAALAQTFLPNPPLTLGQLRMLQEGSTCDIQSMMNVFQFRPRGFQGCGREIPTPA